MNDRPGAARVPGGTEAEGARLTAAAAETGPAAAEPVPAEAEAAAAEAVGQEVPA